MQGRQVEFLADFVHFFADNGDDLVKRALAEEQIGVNAGRQLADVTRPHQEFMACDFGVGRGLAKGGDKEL